MKQKLIYNYNYDEQLFCNYKNSSTFIFIKNTSYENKKK
jgi:hypothetical protein